MVKLVFCRFNIVLHSPKGRRHLEALKYSEFCCSLIGFLLEFVVVVVVFIFFSFSSLLHLNPLPLKKTTKNQNQSCLVLLDLVSPFSFVVLVPHTKRIAAFSITKQSYHTTIHMKFCNAFIDGEILGFGKRHEKALGDQIFFAAVQCSGWRSQHMIIIPSGTSSMQDNETMKIKPQFLHNWLL